MEKTGHEVVLNELKYVMLVLFCNVDIRRDKKILKITSRSFEEHIMAIFLT